MREWSPICSEQCGSHIPPLKLVMPLYITDSPNMATLPARKFGHQQPCTCSKAKSETPGIYVARTSDLGLASDSASDIFRTQFDRGRTNWVPLPAWAPSSKRLSVASERRTPNCCKAALSASLCWAPNWAGAGTPTPGRWCAPWCGCAVSVPPPPCGPQRRLRRWWNLVGVAVQRAVGRTALGGPFPPAGEAGAADPPPLTRSCPWLTRPRHP